ncbi:MAG: type II toxin-antitoxin system VapC family toxin [Actinobacteria bacterium]|nr:type II toxin-antitoxin system VapC family toxin [Actinomycetota bacterium]
MILYLDTSALVKLYIEETGFTIIRNLVNNSDVVATSKISYVESSAAFVRNRDEGAITEKNYHQVIRDFKVDWETYYTIDISESILYRAGDLTDIHKIKALDAIHLASSLILSHRLQNPVTFACWDARFWKAAKKEGFNMIPDKI